MRQAVELGMGRSRGDSDIVARVAQLDRVSASEAAGCGFNSRRAHHFPRHVAAGAV